MDGTPKPDNTWRRGFASLSSERRREIARLGGVKAHLLGTAHTWTSATAAQAGHVGGTRGKRRPQHEVDRTMARLAETDDVAQVAAEFGLTYAAVSSLRRRMRRAS